MRKVKYFMFFALMAHVALAQNNELCFSSSPGHWADINNDGVMEVVTQKKFSVADPLALPEGTITYNSGSGSDRYALPYELVPGSDYRRYIDKHLMDAMLVRDGKYYLSLNFIFYGEDPEQIYGEKWEEILREEMKIITIITVDNVKYCLITEQNYELLGRGATGTSNVYWIFTNDKLCLDITGALPTAVTNIHFGFYFCTIKGDIVATIVEEISKNQPDYGGSYYPQWMEQISITCADTDRDGIAEVFMADDETMKFMKLSGNKYETVTEFPAAARDRFDKKLNIVKTDINIDGRPDYYYKGKDGNHYILTQLIDNTLLLTTMSITIDEKVIGNQSIGLHSNYGNKFVKPTINMSGFSMPGGDYVTSSAFDNIALSVDINLDGYPDFVDIDKGGAFLSLGDGITYYPADFGGKVEVVDMNGDGISDFVVFDANTGQVSTKMSSADGYIEKNVLKNSGLSKMFVRDFNDDGSEDILICIDYQSTGYSYLIFFANDGMGNFKKTENSFKGEYYFNECQDIYGNGTYSVIAVQQEYPDYKLIEFNVPKTLKPTPLELYSGKYPDMSKRWMIIDYNYDGEMDMFVTILNSNNRQEDVCTVVSKTKNTIPEMTGSPKINVDKENGIIRAEWNPASDAQTPTSDLCYNIGIGTEPGKYNIATADAGRELYAMLRSASLATGEYLIAVQATDAGGLKSKWSDPVKYTHSGVYADFTVANKAGVGEDVSISLLTPYNDAYTYLYEPGDGGAIVSAENGNCVIRYAERGEKSIKLTISSTDETAVVSHSIDVNAAIPNETESNVDGIQYNSYFVDFDGDGVPELLKNKLFENDGKGEFTQSGKMFNIDMNIGRGVIDDVNMDGMPDILPSDVYDSQYYVMLNEGELSFVNTEAKFTIEESPDVTSDEISFSFEDDKLYDFDNDGRLDILCSARLHSSIVSYGVLRNMGDNKYKYYPMPEGLGNNGVSLTVADLNSDGLPDVLLYTQFSLSQDSYIMLNKGNCKFELINMGSTFPEYDFYNPASVSSIVDVNNDGFRDVIFVIGNRGQVSRIYFGDKDMKFKKYTQIDNARLTSLEIDIDNDGVIDLIDDYHNIYFWQPDGSFWIEEYDWITNNHPYTIVQYEEDVRMKYKYADVTGDGTPDPFGGSRRTIANAVPTAPSGITVSASAQGVLISWSASTDKETAAHQLKYIVSLKKKGATGSDAYIMSPMDSGNDKAMMLPSMTRKALCGITSVLVPIDRFDSSSEYEIKVKAVDSWYASSPYSETYTFTVGSVNDIESPAVTGVDVATKIRYVGNETSEQTWNWAGGTAVLESGIYNVIWKEAGVKKITCTVAGKTIETSVVVKPRPELKIELPGKVLGGTPISVKLPDVFINNIAAVSLEASDGVEIEHTTGSQEASITFPTKAGGYYVEVKYTDDVFGNISSRSITEVLDFTPEISLVSVDATTGKNKIEWSINSLSDKLELFNKMRIYKEIGSTDNFELIGESEISAGSFVDMQSNPNVRKNRYAIALSTVYGGETMMSQVHGSVHLMINKGVGSTLNLMWNAYEGGVVENYVILRGSTPDNLEVLETLTGHETSFSDMAVPAGGCYYAISYSALAPITRAGGVEAGSNVVSSRDASEITFVENMTIKSVEENVAISNNVTTLHLYAVVTPARATYGDVQWQISEGGDYATISSEGTLTMTGKAYKGNIKVVAKAKDGSGVTAEMDIPCDYEGSGIDDILAEGSHLRVVYSYRDNVLSISGVVKKEQVRIVSLSGALVKSEVIYSDSKMILELSQGVYVVTVGGKSQKIVVK